MNKYGLCPLSITLSSCRVVFPIAKMEGANQVGNRVNWRAEGLRLKEVTFLQPNLASRISPKHSRISNISLEHVKGRMS
jgi:hypothetical protein